jgi:mono/diheme cytochrome c family protein
MSRGKSSATHAVLAVAVAAGSAGACVAIAQTSSPPSVLTGAFTEEQALRGQALYNTHCFACHGEEMAGKDQSPPLAGPQFSAVWTGDPLQALVDRISAMPPDRPGKLSRAENVDILAYVLWYNGLPVGPTPLDTKKEVLSAMIFQTPPPAAR